MPDRIATVVLLVEDTNQERLARRYLQRLGHENRNMRSKLVAGRGSGEQFVREMYASEVRALRSQLARTRACLLVMVDADAGSTADRRRQLDRALQDADEPPRNLQEPILNLVPKRNIETWLLCFNMIEVNETDDYRHDPRINGQAIKRAAETMFSWTRANAVVPDRCVPSFTSCLPEFRRIPGDD